jgi:hypothetical protein
MSANNYNDFFTPEVESNEPKSSQSDEYNPSAAKGKNNIYQAIIRFIPWWQNPKHGSIQDKWVSYLIDPITNRAKYVDCPSSVGKPSPLQDIYWKLKKSESVKEQKLADLFSRRHSYASLIQVIRDENNPELEGKILAFRYGVKLWEKINAELKPVIGEKHDPFDIMNGKAFALVITKVSGFNNYDQSKFVDKRIPLCIPKDGKLIPVSASTDKATIFNWAKDNSPDLTKYAYKEWDQETYDYVNHIITTVAGQNSSSQKYDNIVNRTTTGSKVVSTGGLQSPPITSSNITVDDLNLGDTTNFDISLPDLDLPNLSNIGGIDGDLDDIIKNT